jgi:hypothetical protein
MKTLIKYIIGAIIILWLIGLFLKYKESKPVKNPKVQSVAVAPKIDTVVPSVTKIRYQRGKKGGCYYVNEKGRRVYVDASLCR